MLARRKARVPVGRRYRALAVPSLLKPVGAPALLGATNERQRQDCRL